MPCAELRDFAAVDSPSSLRSTSDSKHYRKLASASLTRRFGWRLRHLRLERNMTQRVLATYLGVDRSFLSDVELGKKSISLDYLEIIAEGLKLSLTELFADV